MRHPSPSALACWLDQSVARSFSRLSLSGRSLVGPAVLSLATATGCSATVAESVDRDAAEGASSAAVVVVERTVAPDETVHASIVARFIRMRTGSVDDDALRMVGATLDLPQLDSCAPRLEGGSLPGSPGGATAAYVADPRAVELLDVGPLAIDSDGVRTALEARSLPDIVDLVSGVVYSTRAVEASGLPSRGLYRLASGGSADGELPSFSVFATAPGEPAELRVEGRDGRGGDVVVSGPVELAWDVADGSSPDDFVYVDVAGSLAGQAPVGPTIRCLFADHGGATIPASAFAASPELDSGLLTVHRVHREAFHVGGIDSGVLRFDFARAVPFTRR